MLALSLSLSLRALNMQTNKPVNDIHLQSEEISNAINSLQFSTIAKEMKTKKKTPPQWLLLTRIVINYVIVFTVEFAEFHKYRPE